METSRHKDIHIFQEEPSTTQATPERKGGRKAWQTSRKRIPKRIDFTLGSNENLFQGRVDSWNNERESEKLGNALDKDETSKDDKESDFVRVERKESEQKNSGQGRQKDINDRTATPDEVLVKKESSKKPVGRKGWAENSREQRRLITNSGETETAGEQVRESTTNEEAVAEVYFKDSLQRLARPSGRHGRKEVEEDDREDEDTVEEEEGETNFLVSGTPSPRGRKAWLNERRRKQ